MSLISINLFSLAFIAAYHWKRQRNRIVYHFFFLSTLKFSGFMNINDLYSSESNRNDDVFSVDSFCCISYSPLFSLFPGKNKSVVAFHQNVSRSSECTYVLWCRCIFVPHRFNAKGKRWNNNIIPIQFGREEEKWKIHSNGERENEMQTTKAKIAYNMLSE